MNLSVHNVQKLRLITKNIERSGGGTFKVVYLEVIQEDKVDRLELFVEPEFSLELGDIV